MLRESGKTSGSDFDLTAIVGNSPAQSGVPGAALLTEFVETVLLGGPGSAQRLRHAISTDLGEAALVDVCATVASFNAVVKIADGSGIPLEDAKEERTKDIRESLGINASR